MILSDGGIKRAIEKGHLRIEPFDAEQLQPSSYDVRLSDSFCTEDGETFETKAITIWPGQFILASTVEWVSLCESLRGSLHGRSSMGRLGLAVHVTAGLIDPGFRGQVTFELKNLSMRTAIPLRSGDRIAHISFERLDEPAERPYGSERNHYTFQRGATPSRWEFMERFRKEKR